MTVLSRCPAVATAVLLSVLCGAAVGQQTGGAKKKKADGARAEPARLQPMPVPRTLVKRRTGAITVDGSLQDWPAAPPLLLDDLRQVSGTALRAYRGQDDLAARAFLLWDDEFLWFAAAVRDDWHVALTADSPRLQEIPPADSIVVTFDPRRDTRAIGRDERRSEDREFWLADVEGQGRRLVQWDRFRGMAKFAEGAAAVVKHDRNRWVTSYEARIPWRDILPDDVKPAEGTVLRVQVVLNDFDEPTDPIAQTRIGWTFGCGPVIDPALMGSVMLMGELDEGVNELPEFPPAPELQGEPVPPPAYWVRFYDKLRQTSPLHADRIDAPEGFGRRERLDELEHHVATFPRVDFLELHLRVHRRMRREVAGMVRTGLPFFYQHVLVDLAARAEDDPPAGGFRLFRLPVGGWLVRSEQVNFAIDAAGPEVPQRLWGALPFLLLTAPADPTKRNDQLLVRMAAAARPFTLHRRIHIPGVDAGKIPLVEIGKSYPPEDVELVAEPNGDETAAAARIRVIGEADEERVSATVGYVVEWADGRRLVHSGETTPIASLRQALPEGTPVDLLILSARHPDAAAFGKAVGARITVLDDVLQCPTRTGPQARVALEEAFALQRALRPLDSVILAPGESIDAVRPR